MKMLIACVVLLTSTLALAQPSSTQPAATQPVDAPVAAIFFQESGMRPRPTDPHYEDRPLVIGIWQDGTVVWSVNREAGMGRPYRIGRVDRAMVGSLLDDLKRMHFFDDEDVKRQPFMVPPDASYTVIAAAAGEVQQRIASWREPPEANDSFKRIYMDAKKRILEIIPESGEPLEKISDVVYFAGRVQHMEGPTSRSGR